MTGGASAACNDFMDFVQALASQVETLKALPERVQNLEARNAQLEARIVELEAMPRSGLGSPASCDLLGPALWERPSADKQQLQQPQQQPTDLLGIETPPLVDAKPLLRQTPPPPQQPRQQQQQQQGSPALALGIGQDKLSRCSGDPCQDPLILADPWASKSATLQVKPPPPVVPGTRLPVKPPPPAVGGTSAVVGSSGLLVKPPPLAVQKSDLQKAQKSAGEAA